jgi:hypothetical protein
MRNERSDVCDFEVGMLDHSGRRRVLYSAVTVLEPYASAALLQHYVARRHDLILPLLRIYVDLERLTRVGHLVRHIKPRIGGSRTTFFWETLGLTLVEPDWPSPNALTAAAPLTSPAMEEVDDIAAASISSLAWQGFGKQPISQTVEVTRLGSMLRPI